MIRKFKLYLLSEQVKYILYTKGLECVFNYQDYNDFKRRVTAKDPNRAEKIANLFIIYNNCAVSDYAEYIF